MRCGIAFILSFVGALAYAQDTVQWKKDADRAKSSSFLAPVDQEIVQEINMARTNPALYATLYIEPMVTLFQGNVNTKTNVESQEGVSALKECIRVMKKTSAMGLLDADKRLYETALYHTSRQSKTNEIGHTSPNGKTFRERLTPLKLAISSECISYGDHTARGIVISLLIDDGVSDRGHRKTILDTRLKLIGVASGSHRAFRYMTTIDFGAELKR